MFDRKQSEKRVRKRSEKMKMKSRMLKRLRLAAFIRKFSVKKQEILKMKMKKIEENDSHVRKAASIAGIELLQIKNRVRLLCESMN